MERSELMRALLRVDTAPPAPPPRRALRRVEPTPGDSVPARLRHCTLRLQRYPGSSFESSPRGLCPRGCVISTGNLDGFPLRGRASAESDAGSRQDASNPVGTRLPDGYRVADTSSCAASRNPASK